MHEPTNHDSHDSHQAVITPVTHAHRYRYRYLSRQTHTHDLNYLPQPIRVTIHEWRTLLDVVRFFFFFTSLQLLFLFWQALSRSRPLLCFHVWRPMMVSSRTIQVNISEQSVHVWMIVRSIDRINGAIELINSFIYIWLIQCRLIPFWFAISY